MSFKDDIIKAANKKIFFTEHALSQMNRPDRLITPTEVTAVIFKGEIIEDYFADPRGHSCLILGFGYDQRPIHVVCAPKTDYVAVITAYIPTEKEWSKNFNKRQKR